MFIHAILKVSAVKYWLKRYQVEGHIDSRPRTARFKALNDNQENEIVERVKENPFLKAASLAREYHVADKTILSLLKRNDLKCRIAARQTRLTEDHRIYRVAFCENMLQWETEKLNRIIFSDEKTFCSDVNWQCKVYRPDNVRYDAKYVKTERLSGRITAGYWGAISINGPENDLVKIGGRLDSKQYASIVNKYVTPMMQKYANTRIFMQDNAPVHTAENVMKILSRQDYDVLNWPALSPDLNPIENVWSYVIRDWPQMESRTPAALDAIIQQRWNELRNNNSELLCNLHLLSVFTINAVCSKF